MKFFLIFSFFMVALFSPVPVSYGAKEKSRFEKLELFNKVLFLVESQYYRKVDTEKLIAGALKGMMSTLDPHSSYLGKDIFSKMREDTSGEFGGLGIEVAQKDGIIVVISSIEDTPAAKIGLRPGDKIVEINHEATIGLTLDQAVEKMRGKANSKINMGIVRPGVDGIKRYFLKREIIKIRPVKFELLQKEFAYIRLIQFQKRSAKSISYALKKMAKKVKNKRGLKGIILDLRSNPGGLLEEAINVSSLFLNDGVVVSTEGRDPKNKEIKYVKKSGHKILKIPIVVLINGASASASEIVAGALQDHGRGIIMGTQSFGKGSVQTVAKIDNEKGVKLTIAQYMTPKGRKIQAIGITPDVFVDEVDAKWVGKHRRESRFIRERDLRNHLNATIETASEKKARLLKEKQERKERISRIRERSSNKKLKKIDGPRKYNPKEDYQVMQAINYIKGFKIFKKMKI